ncbi:glycoside hydrolase family 44 protein [Hymenobacter sp. B81]|uniref:glycoside hydrolase family 44 protein n=1 Tax=Hymenobacter sp. B81 TaxID=3344878 RepID=UPI0037DC861A
MLFSARAAVLLLAAGLTAPAAQAQLSVNFTINTATGRQPISPLIYGTNEPLHSADRYGSVRLGGNRLTGYNWENNASHAGADYNYQNDDFLCQGLGPGECALPGKAVSRFVETARARGQAPLVTLQLAGYVAADKSGTTVTPGQVAPSARWKQVVFRKGSAFSLMPSTADGVVYMDEQVNFLTQQHGTTASGTGVAGYFLDNEPGLWPETHPGLHPDKPTSQELWTKTRDLALAVKAVDPSALIYGGGLYGFGDYFSLQDAPDYYPAVEAAGYAWFIDYYLDNLRQASQAAGRRLIDVLDVHWYPEAVGTNRIIEPGANTALDRQARLQAPRTLWQPGYRENSWIADEPYFLNNYLPILPRLLQSINTYFPGTKLSISEYAYGGNEDISGGLAQADVLGIFGKYGVYNANWWKVYDPGNPNAPASYISPAFRLYTNFDGAGSAFGSTSVTATTSNVASTSVYAAIDGPSEQRLTLVVINKANQAVTGNFTLSGGASYATGRVWSLVQGSPALVSGPAVSGLAAGRFTYTLPALSATAIELRPSGPLPVALTAFDAAAAGAGAQLRWTTATERNAAYFAVERRSGQDTAFRELARVSATNGAGTRHYAWYDAAPQPGLNYYRLQLVDQDRTRTTGPVRAVRVARPEPGAFRVYPTLVAAGELRYEVPAGLTTAAGRLDVLTLAGQQLRSFSVPAGSRHGVVALPNVPPGSYLARLTTAAGTSTQRFVVLGVN